MKKFLCFLFLILPFISYPQTPEDNLKKYWYYRFRLRNDFVKVGPNQGESMPAPVRTTDGVLRYGDATIHLGWYIGVLATEYRLLSDNNQNTFATIEELFFALRTVERLDENAEPLYGGTATLNGFFIRDDIPADFLTIDNNDEHFNQGLTSTLMVNNILSDFSQAQSGTPFIAEMSQDQVIHLLLGLALVKRFVDESVTFNGVALREQAINIVGRILLYISFDGWIIKNPVTSNDVARGPDLRFRSFAVSAAGAWIGQPTPWIDGSEVLWQAEQIGPNTISSNNHMSAVLAAIGDSWWTILPFFPFVKINTTRQGIVNVTAIEGWTGFYLLLLKALHNKTFDLPSVIVDQLNSAPCRGPFFFNASDKAASGWASNLRFTQTLDEQNNGGLFPGEYNGLDYMLLHNLYNIATPDYLSSYVNLMDFREVLNYPFTLPPPINLTIGSQTSGFMRNVQMFRSITSNRTINEDGWVTYRAGSEISLEDGFEVKAGAEFFASVDPFECVGSSYQKTSDSTASLYGMNDPLPIGNNHIPIEYENEEEDKQPLYDIPDTSANQPLQTGFNIYPNPYQTDKLYLDITGNKAAQVLVVVVDMLGIERYSKVFVLKEDNYTLAIDPEGKLPAGVYMVIAASDNEIYRKKIVIQ